MESKPSESPEQGVKEIVYPKNWSTDISKYFTTASRDKPEDVFYATHVPINRIRVDHDKIFNRITDAEREEGRSTLTVTEQDVLKAVTHKDRGINDPNRLFFLVGDTGCGKSELCQWLEYEIKNGNHPNAGDTDFEHVPIHIPRRVREPREVLRRLTEGLDIDIEDAGKLSDLYPDGVYERTLGTIKTDSFTESQRTTHDLLNDSSFESELSENLKEFIDNFEDPDTETEFEPISEEDLGDLIDDYPGIENEHETGEESIESFLYEKITKAAKSAIQDMLQLGDLKDTLESLSEEFKKADRRPVLIIEDLTAFTIYQHELLGFFSDLDAANCDVVIGMTTGMDSRLVDGRRVDRFAADTLNDRIQAKMLMTEKTEDGGSKTLFLEQKDVHIDLAKQYLSAIKSDVDEFSPPLPQGVSAEDVEEAFDGLYPFNREFLTRIYENLQEEEDKRKQTPRVYLKFVLEDLLTRDEPPFKLVNLLSRLGQIQDPIDPDYDASDYQLLRWYGELDETEEFQTVNQVIPQTFGIESDGRAPVAIDDPVPPTENGPDTPEPEVPEKQQRHNELQNTIRAWVRGDEEFNETSAVENGAQEVLTYFYDSPRSLVPEWCRVARKDRCHISWQKGTGTKPRVHVDNGEGATRQIVLSPDLGHELMFDLLKVGLFDEKGLSAQIEDGDVDVHRLRQWADGAVDAYRTELEKAIEAKFGASLDEAALFGKYILNILTGTSAEFTADALAQPVDLNRINRSTLPDDLDMSTKFFEEDGYGEVILGLFRTRFHLRGNVLHRRRLEEHVERTSPTELMHTIGDMRKGIRGFKIGETKSSSEDLQDFLTQPKSNLRGRGRDLRDYMKTYSNDVEATRHEVNTFVQQYGPVDDLSDIDLGPVREAYDVLGKRESEYIDKMEDIDEDRFDALKKRMLTISEKLDEDIKFWDFLLNYRNFAFARYAQFGEEYTTLDRFESKVIEDILGEFRTRRNQYRDTIEGHDIDTSNFEVARNEAQELIDELDRIA